jgi:hypothetical protein
MDYEDVDILSMNFSFDSARLIEKIREYSKKKASKKPMISSHEMHDILKECIVSGA